MIEDYIEKQKKEDHLENRRKEKEIQWLETVYLKHEVHRFSRKQLEEMFRESKLHLCFQKRPDKYSSHFYHCHGWFELVYVYKGNCYNHFMNTNETVILKEKELLIIHPQTPHCTAALHDTDQIFNVIIDLDFIQTILLSQFCEDKAFFIELHHFLFGNQEKKPYLFFKDCARYRVEPIIELILYELERNFADKKKNVVKNYSVSQALVLLLLSNLEYRYELCHKKEKNEKAAVRKQLIYQMCVYMQKNLSSVTLGRMAQEFGYTSTYISHLFHEKMGKSYTSILQKMRMEQSKHLLRDSELSMAEIAEEIGMTYDTFHKLFKRNVGVAPTLFRSEFRDKIEEIRHDFP